MRRFSSVSMSDPLSVFLKLMSRVKFSEDCWEWQGTLSEGYGLIWIDGKNMRTHRVSYQLLIEAPPEDMELDHLCKNRRCLNPEHLEIVTSKENILRGDGPPAKNARKTHCIRGHLLVQHPSRAHRYCKECQSKRQRTWNRKKAKAEKLKRRLMQAKNAALGMRTRNEV